MIIGVLVFVLLPNGPKHARWLRQQEKDFVVHLVADDHPAGFLFRLI